MERSEGDETRKLREEFDLSDDSGSTTRDAVSDAAIPAAGQPDEGGIPESGDDVTGATVSGLMGQVREYRDRLLRLQAEFDNYRKFMENAMATQEQRAGEFMVRDVLEVLDNLERALDSVGEEGAVREGVRMVCAQMHDMLARWGVEEIPSEGCAFDPFLHEAVERIADADAPPGHIVRVFRKGYRMNAGVIRHARVAVAAPNADGTDGAARTGAASGETPPEGPAAGGDAGAEDGESSGEDASGGVNDVHEDDDVDDEVTDEENADEVSE